MNGHFEVWCRNCGAVCSNGLDAAAARRIAREGSCGHCDGSLTTDASVRRNPPPVAETGKKKDQ